MDFLTVGKLEFEAPDTLRFPCLKLAYDALEAGGTASTILNAVNEVAVNAFLSGQIKFTGIPDLIASALDQMHVEAVSSIEHLIETDVKARKYANDWIAHEAGSQIAKTKVVTC